VASEPVIVKLTHKGWFGLCPVYMTDPDVYKGDTMQNAPVVVERHWSLLPVFLLSELVIAMMTYMNEDFEPFWPLRVTGVLKTPEYLVEDVEDGTA
jgi:hypothetical protein